MASRTFRSDNNAGICPEAINALIRINDGSHLVGYGEDAITADAQFAFRAIFGEDAEVFFVASGTAANSLSVAALSEPWQRLVCHARSHLNEDESTAPERLSHLRMTPIETAYGRSRITVDDFLRVARNSRGDVHQAAPGVLSISNPTEYGEVYGPEDIRTLCDAAHQHGFRVHVDGARFANAVASLGCDPRAIANDAGVDALSFGGTKNGLAWGEAVVFFPQGDGRWFERARETFPFHRKSSGHLLSKHRFVAAPFAATLRDNIWINHARHANEMAALLSAGLLDLGLSIPYPTESNGVFVQTPDSVDRALRDAGHEYYMFGDASWNLARLMCSFDTQSDDVDRFLDDARTAC